MNSLDLNALAELYFAISKAGRILPYAVENDDGNIYLPLNTDEQPECTSGRRPPLPTWLVLLLALASGTGTGGTGNGTGGTTTVDLTPVTDALAILNASVQSQPQLESGGYAKLCNFNNPAGFYLVYHIIDENTGASTLNWIDEAGNTGTGMPSDAINCEGLFGDPVRSCRTGYLQLQAGDTFTPPPGTESATFSFAAAGQIATPIDGVQPVLGGTTLSYRQGNDELDLTTVTVSATTGIVQVNYVVCT